MNSKQAKKFRKIAKGMFSAQVEVEITSNYIEKVENRKRMYVEKKDENGDVVFNEQGKAELDIIPWALGTLTNHPNTIRGIYRRLKKLAKAKLKPEGNLQIA